MPSSNLGRDLKLVAVLGGLVGLLIQPILSNTQSLVYVAGKLALGQGVLRALVFVFFIILAPVALFLADWVSRRFWPVLYQIAKFAAVGTLNTLVDLGILNGLSLVLGIPLGGASKLMYASLKGLSFLSATTNSYFWNKLWTFGDQSQSQANTVIKFYLITCINFLLNVGVATTVKAIQAPGINPELWAGVIAPICGVFAGMASNFLGYKYLVFKKAADVSAS